MILAAALIAQTAVIRLSTIRVGTQFFGLEAGSPSAVVAWAEGPRLSLVRFKDGAFSARALPGSPWVQAGAYLAINVSAGGIRLLHLDSGAERLRRLRQSPGKVQSGEPFISGCAASAGRVWFVARDGLFLYDYGGRRLAGPLALPVEIGGYFGPVAASPDGRRAALCAGFTASVFEYVNHRLRRVASTDAGQGWSISNAAFFGRRLVLREYQPNHPGAGGFALWTPDDQHARGHVQVWSVNGVSSWCPVRDSELAVAIGAGVRLYSLAGQPLGPTLSLSSPISSMIRRGGSTFYALCDDGSLAVLAARAQAGPCPRSVAFRPVPLFNKAFAGGVLARGASRRTRS